MDSYQKLEDNDISYKLSKHNPFCMLEFGQVERDITYNIDNYITFSNTKTTPLQRGEYLEKLRRIIILIFVLLGIFLILTAILLKEYILLVPFVLNIVVLYGIIIFSKKILKWASVVSCLVCFIVWCVVLISLMISWNFMIFITSVSILTIYTLFVHHIIQFYYIIPPDKPSRLNKIIKNILCL
jgi:hypothetical protein